ncbi:hypothetical protein C2R22_05880 [Salinigranum rubrum]|uniref:Uncharacterized protein n=1 Tax=Salinigranum rubrum TaxID=755307 RepID=A0A2I8VH44_9EURY|nr:hypothetical protein [Salinigranum rubrum]AUV81247.1 hypothetical protein C2R22_05880 [Salinigranum rubrum]
MPQRLNADDGAGAQPINSLFRLGEGYGWLEGGGVTIASSSTSIDVRVDSGTVRVDGSLVEFSQATLTLPDGAPDNPRRDLVYVDYRGDVGFIQGEPAATVTELSPTDRFQNPVPVPPAATALDGVPLAEVWIPTGETASDNLTPRDVNDLRIADVGGFGIVPVLSADPPEEDLTQTRLWRNDSVGEFRAYAADADQIVSFSTTVETSFSGPTTRLIEDFEDSIKGNWRGGDSTYTYNTPAFEGSAAAYWSESSRATEYSLQGDGLPYYPESGDTVAMAIYAESGNDNIDLGFGKDVDDYSGDNRIRVDVGNDSVQLLSTDADNTERQLGSASPSLSLDTWYIIEADYDGGGTGVHPTRIYSTTTGSDPGQRDTELAAISSPTSDETHQGRGLALEIVGPGRLDYLHALS